VDAVWGDEPPAHATKTLQTHVHRLRAVLSREVIETHRDGYALAATLVKIDAELFESEVQSSAGSRPIRRRLSR
jgi:DNA-binding SARP family transcriptional activator